MIEADIRAPITAHSLLLLGTALGCLHSTNKVTRVKADESTRRNIGIGVDYKADSLTSVALAEKLEDSMSERRKKGWSIGQQVFTSVDVPKLGVSLPMWLTWYEMGEIGATFKSAWSVLNANDQSKIKSGKGLSIEQAEAAMLAKSTTGSSDQAISPAIMLAPLLKQINNAEKSKRADLGFIDRLGSRKMGVPMASPAFVRHLLTNAGTLANCTFDDEPDLDLQEKASFSSCMDEFPRNAVMVKSSWEKIEDGIERFDFSAEAWRKAFATGLSVYAPGISRAPTPGADKIFRLRTSDGQEWALRAIHVVTKDTRKWIWVSFSWSDSPDTDLGSDRPPLPAPWNNYKMTVVTDFIEHDAKPWIGANGNTIDALKTIYEIKAKEAPGVPLTTWGTDPHIETNDPRSNCIGCHNGNIFDNEQTRKNFPTDFSFQVQGTALAFKKIMSSND